MLFPDALCSQIIQRKFPDKEPGEKRFLYCVVWASRRTQCACIESVVLTTGGLSVLDLSARDGFPEKRQWSRYMGVSNESKSILTVRSVVDLLEILNRYNK
jgi:hypothetical protein